MTHDEFDDLDRALAALPLEEPPAGLHARIMAATVYRTAPAFRAWEIWLMGTFLALGAWLIWLVASAPHAGERFADAITNAATTSGLTSDYTLLWLAVGVSTAWWISLLTVPPSRGKHVEAR
jgi:hypothetical protein